VLSNYRIERVIEIYFYQRTSWPTEYGYKEEIEAKQKCRPIHRYNRLERFKNTLDQLLGCRGNISDQVMELMDGVKFDWEEIRSILKKNRLPKLYNQIPLIGRKLGFGNCIEFEDFHKAYIGILKEFNMIHYKFNLMKGDNRKYFPNLRFVALTLIKKWGGKFNLKIPFIRTRRKFKILEKIINECS
jgi:hypothetical protein